MPAAQSAAVRFIRAPGQCIRIGPSQWPDLLVRKSHLTPWLPSVGLFATLPAFAQASANVPGVGTESFLQGLIGLSVVVALIIAAAFVLKRLNVVGSPANAAGMKIVAGLSVGPRERILLLEIGDSWVVVGVTASQMRTLHTLPKGEVSGDSQATRVPAVFDRLLAQVGRRNDAR